MLGLSLCLLICFGFVATAGETKSCCSAPASATAKFASLTTEKSFCNAHLEPAPLAYAPEKGTWVTVKTSDGTDAKFFEVKSDKPGKCPKCGMKKSPTAKMCPDCMKKMKKK